MKKFRLWIFYPKCLKSVSNFMKDLPEVKSFESSQQFFPKFQVYDHAKSLVNFWYNFFICHQTSKRFPAHFTANLRLNIGKKIFYLVIYTQKIAQENVFSEASFSTLDKNLRRNKLNVFVSLNVFFNNRLESTNLEFLEIHWNQTLINCITVMNNTHIWFTELEKYAS